MDEIGELQLPFQAKLLRVLETNEVTRIGSSASIPFNVRIISATNRKLERMVEEGTFRRDLYYRLQVLNLEIPPLRERGRDTLLIAERILENTAKMRGEKKLELSREAEEEMLAYDWPGNIRELKNAMNRLTVLSKGGIIRSEDLEAALYCKSHMHKTQLHDTIRSEENITENASPKERISAKMKEVEHANIELLREAMNLANCNKNAAAELLGVSRKTLYNMLHKYNMQI